MRIDAVPEGIPTSPGMGTPERHAGPAMERPAGAPSRRQELPERVVRMLQAPQAKSMLLRQFGVLSFLVIGFITVILLVTMSSVLRRDLLDREWSTTADYIRTTARHHLSQADFLHPDDPVSQEHFEALYTQAVAMPEIVRVKLYDASMRVIWSDEPRLIGQRFADNLHLARAITGLTVVNLKGDERQEENRYEGNEFADLVEVYVPLVLQGSSRVVGVVETYKVPTQVFASIRRGRLSVAGATFAGGILLYLSLFWIVRRASRRIDEQHQSLEARGQELARANEELKAVQGQLLEAERLAAIGEVVTAVAHGIRNPLANIRAAAQVAGLGEPGSASPTPLRRHLTHIMAEVDRLELRLRELLQFVRPADRQQARVDMNAVVRETAQMVAGRVATGRATLELALAPTLPPVTGNAMLLEQVVLSLFSNAIEAVQPGDGRIRVATRMANGEAGGAAVVVEVQDNGIGIPPDRLASVFKAFYTTKAQGTGLGLAIAKKFTEAHGGALVVVSRPGEVTTFRVTLPAEAAED